MRTTLNADPAKVKVHLTEGTGMDIDWKDGHHSAYSFQYLRDACPCALCNEERVKEHREPGEPKAEAPGALPMFKTSPRPVSAEGVGKYAIRFTWNDGHEHGIYSWEFLREFCACAECRARRAGMKAPGDPVTRTVPH
ncbi:MAG: gamma-butyrobetaine hydroxylase-like domain-containing protein [Terriglobales bacterium]